MQIRGCVPPFARPDQRREGEEPQGQPAEENQYRTFSIKSGGGQSRHEWRWLAVGLGCGGSASRALQARP